jgi:RNA polymerase sigma-70 factor (sigma-E family)
VREAEEREFAEYVAARMAPLRRLGYLVCGDWHLAEDAVSAVLAKLYLAWAEVQKADRVDAYVRRMLLHAIVDERRRPWRREWPAQYPLSGSVSPGGPEDRMVLEQALRSMPRRRRAVLVLRYFEGLSVEETAAALGCATGTVKSQTARGLATLRGLLPADYLSSYGGGA